MRSPTRRAPVAMSLLGLALLVFVGLAACFNFDKAYEHYCQTPGRCDAGTVTAPDAGDGGPPADAGDAGDAGSTDAGDAGDGGDGGPVTLCRTFGASCAGFTQCCSTDDAGLSMGCSRLGYCQPRPAECYEDGYRCGVGSDCCSGKCNGGVCSACAEGSINAVCTQAVDCCIFFDVSCNASGRCELSGIAADNGSRCASSDFCDSAYCNLRDGGVPPDGICADPPDSGGTPCVPVRRPAPSADKCCPGLTLSADNTCCMSDDSYCYYDSACCSGHCRGGRCIASDQAGALGDRCLAAGDCGGGLLCDPVSRTCQNRWCLPDNVPHQGCCSFTDSSAVCRFSDGGVCGMSVSAFSCAANSECCSGVCNTVSHRCGPIQFF